MLIGFQVNILLSSNRFYPDIGGIENIALLLAQDFVAAGHQVRLVTQTSGPSLLDCDFPFKILRQPNAFHLLSSYYWADVLLQVNLESRQLWLRLLYKKPLVIGMQCWTGYANSGFLSIKWLKHKAFGLADRLIACSNAIREEAGYAATVINNPYNSNLFCLNSDVSREKAIVFLGRLVSIKGADMLLEAFAAVRPSGWRLTIIGDGPDLLYLKQLACRLGMGNSVDFLGSLQNEALVHALNLHEIMVIPSRWREPFGIVALEGLACGCVVLAADDGGLVDAVGPAGIVFRRGDQSDLEAKLRFLVNNQEARIHLRAQAPTHLRRFSHHVVSRQYLAILEELVNTKQKQ